MSGNVDILLVFCNAPNLQVAEDLATHVVERRLAACVNILPSCYSVYRWQEKIEKESEIPLLIKTSRQQINMLIKTLVERHPYETPEIIALPVSDGLPDYLQWVRAECTSA